MDKNIMAEVSIILPVYNAAEFLPECLESILHQSFRNFEVLALNDGSADNSLQILKEYASKDKRIAVLNSTINKGLVFQLNKGIQNAKGKYIARMDADDIMAPEKLERQYKYMQQNSNIDLCSSFYKQFGDAEKVFRLPVSNDEIKAFLIVDSPFCHPSVFAKREVFKDDKYDPEFIACEDYELWSRLALKNQFHNLPLVLLNYRIHESNSSFDLSKKARRENKINKIRNSYLKNLSSDITEEEQLFIEQVVTLSGERIISKKIISKFINVFKKLESSKYLNKIEVKKLSLLLFKKFLLSTKRYEKMIGFYLFFRHRQLLKGTGALDLMRIFSRSL